METGVTTGGLHGSITWAVRMSAVSTLAAGRPPLGAARACEAPLAGCWSRLKLTGLRRSTLREMVVAPSTARRGG